jgi:opacity protein-like surface antigen
MKKFVAALCAALMGALTIAPVAEARDYRGHGWRGGYDRDYHRGYRHGRRHDNDNDAIAAGVAGLIIGAVVGSALSRPSYREPPRYYAPPPPPCYNGCGYQGGYHGGYGGGYYAPPPPVRVCYRTESQWDPYAGRYLRVEVPYDC